jgi:guanylate kinase
MANATEEIAHVGEFEYVIINKDFDNARAEFGAIVRAARAKLAIQRERHSNLFRNFGIR